MKPPWNKFWPWAAAWVAFIGACFLWCFVVPFELECLLGGESPRLGKTLLIGLDSSGLIPSSLALLVFWRVKRRTDCTEPVGVFPRNLSDRRVRWFLSAVVILFLLTGLWGAPAVERRQYREAFEFYQNQQSLPREKGKFPHPFFSTPLCVPVFPGVLMSYREYQVGPLAGWGGWEFHVWYGAGVKKLFDIGIWQS